jgi:ABC-type nitrate/sulfonate/bicarbonate transport system permease component
MRCERALRWGILAAMAVFVEGIVRLNVVDGLFLARPSSILGTAWNWLFAGELLGPFAATLYEVTIAFTIAAGIGLCGGYLLWRYPAFGHAYDDLLGALFASPVILLYPIFLVAFGRQPAAIIAMAFVTGVIPIILNTHHGLRDVNTIYLKVAESMKLSHGQMARHVLFPAAFPAIFAGLKLGLTYVLISVIALEFLIEIGGVGTIASKGYFWFNTEELYLGVIAAMALSMLLVYFLDRCEAWLLRHEKNR